VALFSIFVDRFFYFLDVSALECFDFSPKEVLEAVNLEDYLIFLTYTLEYRALVLEQLSHEREKAYLDAHSDPSTRKDGYGVLVLDITIRDLKGKFLAYSKSPTVYLC
jgi:hypothetical protein